MRFDIIGSHGIFAISNHLPFLNSAIKALCFPFINEVICSFPSI